MSINARRTLWALILVGSLGRLVVAFATRGQVFDITSYEMVRDALHAHPLDVYAIVNSANAPHWPYPPGLFPWILASDGLHRLTGLRFDGFVQLAPIAADAVLAWIVQAYLGRRGATERTRLIAAGLVALGPVFAVASGYHGQIDALCILPAVIAFWVWTDGDQRRRALLAGLLVGVGGALKVPALLFVLALIPSVRSRREFITLGAAAAVVPLLVLAPFLAHDVHGTIDGLRGNKGLPGFGGISLLVQPSLSEIWLHTNRGVGLSPASRALFDHGAFFAMSAVLIVGALMARRRTPPGTAAVLLWLTVYAFGINFGITYLIWGLPFFLMTGHLRAVAALQAALVVPMLLLYVDAGRSLPLEVVYVPIMLAVWASLLVWWVREARAALRPSVPLTPHPEPA
jgi:hypothetical protein